MPITSDQVQQIINLIIAVSVALVALSGVFATSLVLVVRQNKNLAEMLYQSVPVQYRAVIRADVVAAKQAIDLADEITAPGSTQTTTTTVTASSIGNGTTNGGANALKG